MNEKKSWILLICFELNKIYSFISIFLKDPVNDSAVLYMYHAVLSLDF